jgi:AraC-like DNA-binding protein
MPILFDTGTVAPHERFDFWMDSSDRAFFPCTFRRLDDRGFAGTVNQYLLGPLTISRVTSAATSVSRTWADIASHDPEAVHLSLQLRGCTVFSQNDRATAVSAGEMVLYDTSHPFSIVTDEPYDLVVLECSRMLLGLNGRDPAPHSAEPLQGEVARMLVAPFLNRLAHGLADGSVSEGDADLGESALYLLRALCVDTAEAQRDGRRQSAGTLLARVKVHIEQRLSDPDLRPDTIAAAHYVSTRHLQKLFKADGMTVTDWIRERRLAGCRRDLRDPAQADETILGIATRWGLTNPAHFSRSFRAVYGCSPSEFRAMDGGAADAP